MRVLEDVGFAAGVAKSSDIARWKKHLLAHRDELITAVAADTKRSKEECFLVEWGPVENALNFLEDTVDETLGPRLIKSSFRTLMGNRILSQRRLPVGAVLVLGTWNFPLALHLTQILFARATGNSVVFKPSALSPELGKAIESILAKLWSREEFRVWNPPQDSEILEAIRHREFQLVLFTGGTGGARIIAQACGEAMVPFIPEASGSEAAIVAGPRNPVEISEDVDHLLWALYHHSGQTCVAPRFWFVPRALAKNYFAVASQFLDSSAETATSRAPLKNPSVEKEHAAWKSWVESQGVELKYENSARHDFSLFLLKDSKNLSVDSPATFGPAGVILPFDDIREVVEWTRRSPWSLMTTVMGNPNAAEKLALNHLDASIVGVNESVTSVGDAAIPFGGRGLSGYGATHGIDGLLQMSRSQTWVEVHAWPGMAGLRPAWRKLLQLNKAGSWLKEIDPSPIKTAKNLFSKVMEK